RGPNDGSRDFSSVLLHAKRQAAFEGNVMAIAIDCASGRYRIFRDSGPPRDSSVTTGRIHGFAGCSSARGGSMVIRVDPLGQTTGGRVHLSETDGGTVTVSVTPWTGEIRSHAY